MENKITILGSGTCVSSFYKPFDFRYSAAHLVQTPDLNILFDCSEGVRDRLNQIKFDFIKLDVILISHFHPDHFNMVSLIQSLGARAKKEKMKKKLTIAGPKRIQSLLIRYWEGDQKIMIPPDLDITFEEFTDGKKLQLNQNVAVTSHSVIHGDVDAYALRLNLSEKTLTYSGDSGVCEGLVNAAKKADIFICECAYNVGDQNPHLEEHLTPYLVGETAKKAGAKKLIVVHYNGEDSNEAMIADIQKAGFDGEIIIADDFSTFTL